MDIVKIWNGKKIGATVYEDKWVPNFNDHYPLYSVTFPTKRKLQNWIKRNFTQEQIEYLKD